MFKSLSYKIEYPKCQCGGLHEGQNLNIVCLNDKCNFPVICSLCKVSDHKNHETKTLKHFLESITHNISNKKNDTLTPQLIQSKKEQFLQVMREGIESMASSFFQLQVLITNIFDKILAQVNNKKQSQSTFQQFYSTLQKQKAISNISLITNYSNCNKKVTLPHLQHLEQSLKQMKNKVIGINNYYQQILKKQYETIKPNIISKKQQFENIKLPMNTTLINKVITHKKQNSSNIVLLYHQEKSEMFKLSLQFIQKPQKVYVGVMSKSVYENYPKLFNPKNMTNQKNIAWICSDGSSSKCKSNKIQKYANNQLLSLTLRKEQLVVKKKSDKQFAILLVNHDEKIKRYFFIAMEGNGKIELANYQFEEKSEKQN